MSNEKEILNGFKKWVDNQIDFNKLIGGVGGAIAESADGMVFGLIIDYGYSKLPEGYKPEALAIMAAILSGNTNTIAREAIQSLVKNVSTPLGDEKEIIIVEGVWGIVEKLAFRQIDGSTELD